MSGSRTDTVAELIARNRLVTRPGLPRDFALAGSSKRGIADVIPAGGALSSCRPP